MRLWLGLVGVAPAALATATVGAFAGSNLLMVVSFVLGPLSFVAVPVGVYAAPGSGRRWPWIAAGLLFGPLAGTAFLAARWLA